LNVILLFGLLLHEEKDKRMRLYEEQAFLLVVCGVLCGLSIAAN
jgi:hypothetical protein